MGESLQPTLVETLELEIKRRAGDFRVFGYAEIEPVKQRFLRSCTWILHIQVHPVFQLSRSIIEEPRWHGRRWRSSAPDRRSTASLIPICRYLPNFAVTKDTIA